MALVPYLIAFVHQVADRASQGDWTTADGDATRAGEGIRLAGVSRIVTDALNQGGDVHEQPWFVFGVFLSE